MVKKLPLSVSLPEALYSIDCAAASTDPSSSNQFMPPSEFCLSSVPNPGPTPRIRQRLRSIQRDRRVSLLLPNLNVSYGRARPVGLQQDRFGSNCRSPFCSRNWNPTGAKNANLEPEETICKHQETGCQVGQSKMRVK